MGRCLRQTQAKIHTKTGRQVANTRITATSNSKRIEDYSKDLLGLQRLYDIKPSSLANMNETGAQEGEREGSCVTVGTSANSRTRTRRSEATNWVTILECMTTERYITPGIIY